MRKLVLAALSGLAFAPIAASAETICAPSDGPTGYYACASVTVHWDAGNIVLSVQNLDSWSDIGMTTLAGGYRLNGIGLIGDPTIAGLFNSVTVATTGGVGVVGSPAGFWSFTTSLSGDLAVEAGSDIDGQAGSILGCQDAGSLAQDHFRTCSPTFPGMVTFTFSGEGISEADFLATNWEYSLRGGSGPEEASFKCGPEAELEGEPRLCNTTTTTVPEPMSMLLMGTGLIGVGLFTRRRRQAGIEDA